MQSQDRFRKDYQFGPVQQPVWKHIQAMPDHLAKPGAYVGTACDELDPDLELERDWLASSLRCFLDDGCDNNSPKQQAQYRLPTYRWLVMIDCFLRSRTTQGLEAFSSPQTANAAAKLLSASESVLYRAVLIEKWWIRDARTCCGAWPWIFLVGVLQMIGLRLEVHSTFAMVSLGDV